jgi:hypothetical protein
MSTDCNQSEPGTDRRQERRFGASWPVEYALFGSENILGQSAVAVDLSRESLCLKTEKPLIAGMNLCIRIQKPDGGAECKEEGCFVRMLSVSEVKWCRKIKDSKKGCYLAGIKHVMDDYWQTGVILNGGVRGLWLNLSVYPYGGCEKNSRYRQFGPIVVNKIRTPHG